VMIFLALLGSDPDPPMAGPGFEPTKPAIACNGDEDCERRHHRIQGAQSNWATTQSSEGF
jgi:hypothetical protein